MCNTIFCGVADGAEGAASATPFAAMSFDAMSFDALPPDARVPDKLVCGVAGVAFAEDPATTVASWFAEIDGTDAAVDSAAALAACAAALSERAAGDAASKGDGWDDSFCEAGPFCEPSREAQPPGEESSGEENASCEENATCEAAAIRLAADFSVRLAPNANGPERAFGLSTPAAPGNALVAAKAMALDAAGFGVPFPPFAAA